MLINKDDQIVTFINKETGQLIKETLVKTKLSTKFVDDDSEVEFFDNTKWFKGILLSLIFMAAVLYAIVMSIVQAADANASWIDEVNQSCVDSDQACAPINVQGVF